MRKIIVKAAAVVLLPICAAGTITPRKLTATVKSCCWPCPASVCPIK